MCVRSEKFKPRSAARLGAVFPKLTLPRLFCLATQHTTPPHIMIPLATFELGHSRYDLAIAVSLIRHSHCGGADPA